MNNPATRCDQREAIGLSLGFVCLMGFLLRVAYRLHAGESDLFRNGYTDFYDIARSAAAGRGLTAGNGGWAVRQPGYPLLLTIALLLGGGFRLIVVLEALLGTLTVGLGFLIGRGLFGKRAGLIAASLAAIYPYYVVHDTALQDTSMATAGAAVAVYALLRSRTSASVWLWAAGGALLGLSVLIRATLLPFALGAVAWIAIVGDEQGRRRPARTLVVAACAALIVGGWMARNDAHLGRFVLSSETGEQFWVAHNSQTFSHYPTGSIDASEAEAFRALSPADSRTLDAGNTELGQDDWFMAKGLRYVRDHPADTLAGSLRKEAAGFSWTLNPAREPLVQLLYFCSYVPVLSLGLAGMALSRRCWREHSLIYIQFLGFVLVTAAFWAHTSHRSFLDIYLMIFAGPVIDRTMRRVGGLWRRWSERADDRGCDLEAEFVVVESQPLRTRRQMSRDRSRRQWS
jgi:4-amino-4-deoxy-L-arabinose transferase-like glycosyltransferase